MKLPFATITERKNYIKVLIEEERPHSLMRVMRKRPLVIYKVIDLDMLFGLGRLEHEMTVRGTQNILWIEYDGLEQLKQLPLFYRLNVWTSDKEVKRIIKILELMFWPPKFKVFNQSYT